MHFLRLIATDISICKTKRYYLVYLSSSTVSFKLNIGAYSQTEASTAMPLEEFILLLLGIFQLRY